MIIVDLINSYIISIVLLVITYFYLAETKSILHSDTSQPSLCGSQSNTYLLYTTGTCFKYYKVKNNRLDLESLSQVINLTDCESSTEHQLFREFDYYFDRTGQLNLLVFEKREGHLFGGRLDLKRSSFERTGFYGKYDNITITIDRSNKIAYIADQQKNRIESIDLINNRTEILSLNVKAPYSIEVLSGKKLFWIEYDNEEENRKTNELITCFYEWSIGSLKQKKQIGCVNERVQSFELDPSTENIYYITRDGGLYLIDQHLQPYESKAVLNSRQIYKPIQIKRKYQIQIFKFKLLPNKSSFDLYLSDLVHQGLLFARLDDLTSNRPTVLFTDQPSLFDFKFIDSIEHNCKSFEQHELSESSQSKHKSNRFTVDKTAKPLVLPMNETNSPLVEIAKELSIKDAKIKDELIKENYAIDSDFEMKGSTELLILNSNLINDDQSIDCLLCSTPLFYSIVFIVLLVLFILVALLVLLSKKFEKFNTLIDSAEENDEKSPSLKRKLYNIQFNIKKTIQTM